MNFTSNLLNSIPVIGHAKALIHYAAGDKAAGDEAMYQSSRTSAVIAGGAIGSVAGPAGAAAAAIYAGYLSDAVASIASNQPRGILEGFSNIADDVADGRFPARPLLDVTLQVGFDGLGAAGIGDFTGATGKNIGKKIVTDVGEEIIEKSVEKTAEEIAKLAARKASEKAMTKSVEEIAENVAIQAAVHVVNRAVYRHTRE